MPHPGYSGGPTKQLAHGDSVDGLGLSVRANNILAQARILTIAQLMGKTGQELLAFPNSGKLIVRQIRKELYDAGRFRLADGWSPTEADAVTKSASTTKTTESPAESRNRSQLVIGLGEGAKGERLRNFLEKTLAPLLLERLRATLLCVYPLNDLALEIARKHGLGAKLTLDVTNALGKAWLAGRADGLASKLESEDDEEFGQVELRGP